MTSTHTWARHCTASRLQAGALTGSRSPIASQARGQQCPGLRSASQTSSKRSLGRYTRKRKDAKRGRRRERERRDVEKGPQGEDEGEEEDEGEGEGKSCNEDSTSIENDKAACVAPAAFNEHSASQPRSAGPFDEYLLLRTRYSIPFR